MLDDPDDVEANNHRAGPDAPKRSTAPKASAPVPAEVNADIRFMGSDEDLPGLLDKLDIDDRELADTSDEDDDYGSDAESETSTIRPDYSLMDEDGSEFFFLDDDDEAPDLEDDDDPGHSSDSSDEAEDETGSVGDTSSISPSRFDDEDFCITQPAWDDVPENFFSDDLDDRDYEHLISHSFGLVHASSGLKRVMKGNLKHEVDFCFGTWLEVLAFFVGFIRGCGIERGGLFKAGPGDVASFDC